MYNIDPNLYASNAFYRDLVDEIREIEQMKRQLQMERDRLQAEREAYYRQQMIGYANQIPYSCMTPVSPYQWRVPYATMQDNFVSYWMQINRAQERERIVREQQAAQRENLCRVFHAATDMAAFATKRNAPVVSIVLDGVGLLTARNLTEAAKSIISIIDTAEGLSTRKENGSEK